MSLSQYEERKKLALSDKEVIGYLFVSQQYCETRACMFENQIYIAASDLIEVFKKSSTPSTNYFLKKYVLKNPKYLIMKIHNRPKCLLRVISYDEVLYLLGKLRTDYTEVKYFIDVYTDVLVPKIKSVFKELRLKGMQDISVDTVEHANTKVDMQLGKGLDIKQMHLSVKDDKEPKEDNKIKELIPIKQNDVGTQAVSGRALHEFLEIKTRYDKWFQRMAEYGSEENHDHILVVQKRPINNPRNPETTITYHALTIDCAKEISMLQRNKKGRQARQYFIQCEKRLKTLAQGHFEQQTETKEMTMACAVLIAQETMDKQAQELNILRPQADWYLKLVEASGRLAATEIAKEYGMSARTFNSLLNELGIQYKVNRTWITDQKYADQGYVEYKSYEYTTEDGLAISNSMYWTSKGREFLFELLKDTRNILAIVHRKALTTIS